MAGPDAGFDQVGNQGGGHMKVLVPGVELRRLLGRHRPAQIDFRSLQGIPDLLILIRSGRNLDRVVVLFKGRSGSLFLSSLPDRRSAPGPIPAGQGHRVIPCRDRSLLRRRLRIVSGDVDQGDSYKLFLPVELQGDQPLLLPVAQGPADVPLRVVQGVGHGGNRKRAVVSRKAAEEVEVNLHELPVRVLHIFVYKNVRYGGNPLAGPADPQSYVIHVSVSLPLPSNLR